MQRDTHNNRIHLLLLDRALAQEERRAQLERRRRSLVPRRRLAAGEDPRDELYGAVCAGSTSGATSQAPVRAQDGVRAGPGISTGCAGRRDRDERQEDEEEGGGGRHWRFASESVDEMSSLLLVVVVEKWKAFYYPNPR